MSDESKKPRSRIRDLTDEEARAEAELLRDELEEADKEDLPFIASQWYEESEWDDFFGDEENDVLIIVFTSPKKGGTPSN